VSGAGHQNDAGEHVCLCPGSGPQPGRGVARRATGWEDFDMTDLAARVDALETGAFWTRVATLRSKKDRTEATKRMDEFAEEVKLIRDGMDLLSQEDRNVAMDVRLIQQDMTLVKTGLAKVADDVELIKDDVRQLKGGLADVRKDMEQGFKSLRTDLTDVQTDVASVRTGMGEVKTDVASVKTDVASVKTDVASVKTDVAEVKKEMKVGLSLIMDKLDLLDRSHQAE
jgi:chromosome segregation ATPase